MSRFIPHTVESVPEVMDGSQNAEGALSNTQFKLAEQSVGFNLDEAVLLQSNMKGIANVPLPRYVDWFHNIVASG